MPPIYGGPPAAHDALRHRRGGEYSQHPLGFNEPDHLLEAVTGLEIGELERPLATHLLRVVGHDLERGADHRREVDLVDDEEIRLRDARPALARDLVARGDVDDVERQVRELRAERGGEVVAARLDEHQVQLGKALRQPRYRLQVDRSVLADRRVRTAAGLDTDDALGSQRLVADEKLRVFLGVDVVRHDGDLVAAAQRTAKRKRQRGLARADRSADAHAQRHDLNSRLYCVSWCAEKQARPAENFTLCGGAPAML